AGRLAQQRYRNRGPYGRPVFCDIALLARRLQGLRIIRLQLRAQSGAQRTIVGMAYVEKSPLEQFLSGITEGIAKLLVDAQVPAVECRVRDSYRSLLERRAKLRMIGGERCNRAF